MAASMSVSRSFVGSSRMSTFGSLSRMSSSCRRRFWPPERFFTGVESCAFVKPSRSSSWPGVSSTALEPSPTLYAVRCSAMTALTRWSAHSASSASSWLRVAIFTVLPRFTRPVVGCTAPVTSPSRVDLPAPFTPRMPVRSPGAMRHSSSCSTVFVVRGAGCGIRDRVHDRHVLEVDDVLAEARDREAAELDRVAHGRLVLDELVGRLDAELRLARSRRCARAAATRAPCA